MSQRALSFPGCTAAYISRIENGERIPSLQLLREFAARLGVAEEYLAHGREEAPVARGGGAEASVAIRMGDLETARSRANADLDDARTYVDRAAAFSMLGRVSLAAGDLDAARAALEHAVQLDPRLEERDRETASALGAVYLAAGDHDEAVAVLSRNFDRAAAAGDPVDGLRFATLLASALLESGDVDAAEQALSAAVAASDRAGDPMAAAGSFWSRSREQAEQGDAAGSVRSVERARTLLDASDQRYDAARARQLLAHVELERGNGARAAELLEAAAPALVASGRTTELTDFRIDQARALLKAGRRDDAAEIAAAAAAALAASPATPETGRSYSLLGDVFVELGDDDRAVEAYETAIERFEGTPSRHAVDACTKLAEVFERRGDQSSMIKALKRGLSIQALTGSSLIGR